jgi:hypothetical protein
LSAVIVAGKRQWRPRVIAWGRGIGSSGVRNVGTKR